MEKEQIAACFARARRTYDREARVQLQAARRMLDLLRTQTDAEAVMQGADILEVGCGTGLYSRLLADVLHPRTLWLNDLCPDMAQSLADLLARPGVHFLPGDAEDVCLPPRTRVITSCSTLQWFARPEIFFARCLESLMPGGILAFSTFGKDNLREIRALTGHGLAYFSPEAWARMLPDGFRLVHASEEVAVLSFPTPTDVLRHLKQTGVTGTERRMWTRTRLEEFCNGYIRRFGTPDGTVTLTYHPIYIIAQKQETR